MFLLLANCLKLSVHDPESMKKIFSNFIKFQIWSVVNPSRSTWLQYLPSTTVCLIFMLSFLFLLGSLKSLLFSLHKLLGLCSKAAEWMVSLLWPTHCPSWPSDRIYHKHWKRNIHKSAWACEIHSQNYCLGVDDISSLKGHVAPGQENL